ncbi:toll-like receptor 13 [Battus philenor]|uniref:toll-like receptor 13 n=1 Tax=Battus philenor TaxID=42288 RepID=UPI0035D114CF
MNNAPTSGCASFPNSNPTPRELQQPRAHVLRLGYLPRSKIVSCLLHGLSAQPPPPPMERCLTGYMTDIQSWVDFRGRLTSSALQENAIDVSYQLNSIGELRQQMQNFGRSRNNSVQYLSLARCQLRWVPRLFLFRDSSRRILTDTVVYLTLFGNDFDPAPTIDRLSLQQQEYEMRLDNNNLNSISWAATLKETQFPHLKELDLRICGITELGNGTFSTMPNLEKLYLGENNIFHINSLTFTGLKKLIHLDISRNCENDTNGNFQGFTFDDFNVFSGLVNLSSLDLSYSRMSQRNVHAFKNISKNLQKLSICNSGLTNIGPDIFDGTSIRFLDVSGNANIFSNIKGLQCVSSTLQVVYADNIALTNFDVFENLTSLEILRVSNNEITEIKEKTAMTLPSLQVLDMDANRVTTWHKPTVSLMPELKLLSLRNNNINSISEVMAIDFTNLTYIGLSGNFIVCNCNLREIFEIAIRNEKNREDEHIHPLECINRSRLTGVMYVTAYDDVNTIIANRNPVRPVCVGRKCEDVVLEISGNYLLLDYNQNTYHCLMMSNGISTSVKAVPSCKTRKDFDGNEVMFPTWNRLYLLIILLIILPFLFYGFVYRRNLRYFLITVRNSATLSLISREEIIDENTIFNYDVFVSYCNDDRAWVLDHLLPHVEKDCSISVCLHERDFMVGLSILENIVSCMDRSKTIMLILSQKFLLSQWCQFEMHLAQHRLLETRREDLILVLLEDIPRRLRPNTLHYLMLTNTYIVWPKEESERHLFWRRLKKSLVIHKMQQPENVSLA